MHKINVTVGGIVLCGGKSRRMGQPKLALPFGTESMLARVVRILGEVVSPIVVVAAQGQQLPEDSGDILIARDEREDLGPLEGLAVGLSRLHGEVDAAFVTACDAPLLKPAFIRRLVELLGDNELVIPQEGKYHHPLTAVYRTSLVDRAQALIASGRMRPLYLRDECQARIVDVNELREVDPRLDSLRNTNTENEYRAALVDAGIRNDITQETS